MSKEIDFLTNTTSNSKVTSSSIKTEKKEGASLFDSILSDVKKTDTNVENKNSEFKDNNTNKNIGDTSKSIDTSKESNTGKISSENQKSEIETVNKDVKNVDKDNSLDETKNKKVGSEVLSSKENRSETKSNTSLLDRLLFEAKNDISKNNEKLEQNLSKKVNEKKFDNLENKENSLKDKLSDNKNLKDNNSLNNSDKVSNKNSNDSAKNDNVENSKKIDTDKKIINDNKNVDNQITSKEILTESKNNKDIVVNTENKENTLTKNKIDNEDNIEVKKDLTSSKIEEKDTFQKDKINKNIKESSIKNLDSDNEKTDKTFINNKENDSVVILNKNKSEFDNISTIEKKEKVSIKDSSSKNIIENETLSVNEKKEETNTKETPLNIEKNKKVVELKDSLVTNDSTEKNQSIIIEKENKTDVSVVKNTESVSNSTLASVEDFSKEKNINTTSSENIISKNEKVISPDKNEKTIKDKPDISDNIKHNESKPLTSLNLDKTEKNISQDTNNSFLSNDSIKNEKVAKELSSVATIENQKVNISKSDIENLKIVPEKNDEKISLLDKLIEKNKTVENKIELGNESKQIDQSKTDSILPTKSANDSKEILTNIYLSSQKNSVNNQSLANKKDAVTQIKEGKTTSDIKEGAEKLDLGLQKVEIEVQNSQIKSSESSFFDKKSFLDRLAFSNNIKFEDTKIITNKVLETSNTQNTSTDSIINNLPDVTVSVNPFLAQSIQSRIIGARQNMTTLMSDVARQMYENYKPPVTAFRINLNPANLGHIAIIMKSDKDNAINISMNISNSATLDVFVDTQNGLKNALSKTFNEDSQFNLDFNSNENSNEQSSSNNQQEQRNSKDNIDTQTILNSRETNKINNEEKIDYL